MARRSTSLHAVPAKTAAKRAPAKGKSAAKSAPARSVATAAKSSNPRDLKVAIRDRLAEAISKPNCPARELSILLKQLDTVVDDIAELDADEAGDQDDAATSDDDNSDDSFDTEVI